MTDWNWHKEYLYDPHPVPAEEVRKIVKELIGEFIEKINYYLKTDDCDPIAYFIKVKEEYEMREL